MSVLDVPPRVEELRDPAFSVTLNGDGGPLEGWVVADSFVGSMAMGGTRMTGSVTEEEVRALARGMTEKLALVGLPIGGAKAGIVAGGDDRDATLRTFGRTVAPLLHGGIHLGCDLGVTPADRAVFFAEAGYEPCRGGGGAPMPFDWATYYEPLVDCTGFGVGVAAVTALAALGRREPCRVVVQGFGTVGRSVARFLEDRGHHIVGVADVRGTVSAERLPAAELVAVTDSLGRIDRSRLPEGVAVSSQPDGWLDVDCDLVVLAANKDAVHAGNVHRLNARLVVEGGNLCCSPEAKRMMAAAGVTLVPDVVANVGGAAVGGLALTRTVPFGFAPAARRHWVFDWVGTRVRRNTRDLLETAATTDDPLPSLLTARRRERP